MSSDQRKNRYYCRRCKRYLSYKICPIHGIEHTEVIKTDSSSSGSTPPLNGNTNRSATPQPGEKINDKFALPAPGESQKLNNLKTPSADASIARITDTPASAGNDAQTPADEDDFSPVLNNLFKDDNPAPQRPPVNNRPTRAAATDFNFDQQQLEDRLNGLNNPQPQQPVQPQPQQPTPPAASQNMHDEMVDSISSIDIESIFRETSNQPPRPQRPHAQAQPQAQAQAQPQPQVQQDPQIHATYDPMASGIHNPVASATSVHSQPRAQRQQRRKPRRKPAKASQGASFLKDIPSWAWIATLVVLIIIAGTVVSYNFQGAAVDTPTAVESNEPGIMDKITDNANNLWASLSSVFATDETAPAVPATVDAASIPPATEATSVVNQLLDKANLAYTQGNLLTPENENAVAYLNQILEEEPEHAGALDLQDQILLFYFEAAEEAIDAQKFDGAVGAYQNILKIKPGDPEIISEINRTLELKKVTETLNNMSELSKTQQEVKELQKEKYRLRSEVQKEKRRLTSRGSTAVNRKTRPSTAGRSGKPIEVSGLDKLGINSEDGSVNALDIPEDDLDALGIDAVEESNPLVGETMIDGGRKEYVHRDKPFIPLRLRSDKKIVIEAECVVDIDGRVESVNILSPTKNPQLNQLALNSFKNYRFKPATYKGNPVRFRSVELLAIDAQ